MKLKKAALAVLALTAAAPAARAASVCYLDRVSGAGAGVPDYVWLTQALQSCKPGDVVWVALPATQIEGVLPSVCDYGKTIHLSPAGASCVFSGSVLSSHR